jgi:drug/metabolite transporter (DMT)-like permease
VGGGLTPIALGLASSLCWGVADFLGGLQSRRLRPAVVILVSQAAGLAGSATIVAAAGGARPPAGDLLAAGLAGVAAIVALSALYRALSVGTMSIVMPISATGAALPVIVGIATGDRPSAWQLAGFALAMAGVAATSAQAGDDLRPTAGRRRASVGLAVLAAVGIGGFLVAMDAAADRDLFWALLVARLVSVLGFAAWVAGRRVSVSVPRGDLATLLVIGGLDLAANALFAWASTLGALSVVGVLATLYPLVTVAFAQLVLRERLRGVQYSGVAATFVGVALIVGGQP